MKKGWFGVFFWAVIMMSCGDNSSNQPAKPQPEANAVGKEIFTTKCASCHRVNTELTGPALKGVEDRWPDKKLLYAFIRNSTEVIKTNQYAHDLWIQYNQTQMNLHPDMTDQQIQATLDYIKAVSQ